MIGAFCWIVPLGSDVLVFSEFAVDLLQKCGSMARGAASSVSPLFETDSITDVLGLRTAAHV